MRFLLAFLFCCALVSTGLLLRRHQPVRQGFTLSVGHRSLQQVIFDELHLRRDPRHATTQAPAEFNFEGFDLPVLLRALKSQGDGKLIAVQIDVDEKEAGQWRSLIFVKADSAEAKLLQRPPAGAPLKKGELVVNGKSWGEYLLWEHPFHAALKQGQGPFVQGTPGAHHMCASGKSYVLLQRLAQENAATLPVLQSEEWALWHPDVKAWRVWGSWPKEWPL